MEVMRLADEKLPEGLYLCRECGAVRGETRELPDDWIPDEEGETATSTCFCEGLICSRCGRRRRRRPISDYYDPADRRWWHVPSFAAHSRVCNDCRSEVKPDGDGLSRRARGSRR